MTPALATWRGWWLVLVAAIGLSTSPGQFAFGAIGLFMVPFGAEFGWSRAGVSAALTLFTAALAVSLPVIGLLVDRYGARRVLLPSVAAFGVLLAAIPLAVTELWHLLVVFVLIGSLAAGSNSLPYMRALASWFVRRRGLAYGIAMAGGGLGYAYVPPLVQYCIDHYGWRSGYYALAALVLAVALPLLYACFRDSPAEIGLAADGEDPACAAPATAQRYLTRAEALRSPAFRTLFAVFAALSFALYGQLAHLVPLLTDRGMAATEAALVASVLGMTIIAARAFIGYLIDRLFAPHVAAGCFLASALGMVLLAGGATGAPAYLAAVCVGLSIGAEIDLLAYLTSRYFGLASFGQLYGIMFAAFLLGASLGPFAFGLAYEASGSYTGVLFAAIALVTFAAVITARLPRY